MQFSKKNEFIYQPHWNDNIEYYKEQDRGYEYREDLFVPGHFELPIKKGESVIFSAGLSEASPRNLDKLWESELAKRIRREDMYSCLKNSAQQFYKKEGDKIFLMAGYPWFTTRARDQFVALPGCTLCAGGEAIFDSMMSSSVPDVEQFLAGNTANVTLQGIDKPDVLLWFIWTVQQYARKVSPADAAEKYGHLVEKIISFIRKQAHPNLLLHNNGLLYVNGRENPATWMDAIDEGMPITPRTGYVVEINALWYNALKFAAEMAAHCHDEHNADLLNYRAEISKESFIKTFWNEHNYLYDYVDGTYKDYEVRPNMIFAVGLPYSPLEKSQQKKIVDIVTRELLTPKGLRTLSPKSGSYRPVYIGGQKERDRNYHNGPIWPWTLGAYATAYLRIYKQSGISFIERMLFGFEDEMKELCIGTFSELFDGNPPFKGHGGISFAMNVAEILRILDMLAAAENNEL
ncbi:MAG: amylo-alpha-1,6-glucosidase, partial [Prevotellaceae bacterium]|jgi:predicted glycogen debranching enzyme|nr:amylo-alpha-1,6-glucosidase [Prevotellaceae bacterium]